MLPALVLWGFSPARVVAGQLGQESLNERELAVPCVPVAWAVEVNKGPVIDGDVLSDPVWKEAPLVSDFQQTRPDEGEAASERTEVRIVYDQDTLYFGVVCYVTDPRTVIVSDSRRDTSLTDTDSFRIIFDTYRDQQNGFVFGTNPAGLEYDGQVTGGGFNLNWDGVWQVRARVSEIGWTAEFAIPFRTLRYPSDQTQIFGINFQRNIRSNNEQAFWAPLPRQFGLYRLSLAG